MPNKYYQEGVLAGMLAGGVQANVTNIGYQVTFKVDGNDYYVASCQQGENITAPPIPTMQSGVFAGWQLNGVDVVMPYTPNANIELTAKSQNVPDIYRPVEYLEVTTSGPYINTGVSNTANAYFEIDGYYTSAPSNNYALFGAAKPSGEYTINLYDSPVYCCVGVGSNNNKITLPEPLVRHTYKADADALYIDGSLYSTSISWNYATSVNYYLFAMNYNGTTYRTANARIYGCKLWNDTTLVRNFVPVRRVADNVGGMWDLINEVFYTNDGTGSFINGPDV